MVALGSGAMTVVIISVNSGGGRGSEDERDHEDDMVVQKQRWGRSQR